MKNKVMTSVRKPTCAGCPDSFRYEGSIPMKQHGVMMHLGERYCIGGRKGPAVSPGRSHRVCTDMVSKAKEPL